MGRAEEAAAGASPGGGHRRVAPLPPAAPAAARRAPARGHGAAGPTAAAGSADPADRGEAPRALNAAVREAAALYRRFTRLPARAVERVPHRRLIPPVVVDLGRLMAVVYRSDKWVGHPRTYIHRMDDPPRLVSDVDGRRLFVVGGSYRITDRGIEG